MRLALSTLYSCVSQLATAAAAAADDADDCDDAAGKPSAELLLTSTSDVVAIRRRSSVSGGGVNTASSRVHHRSVSVSSLSHSRSCIQPGLSLFCECVCVCSHLYRSSSHLFHPDDRRYISSSWPSRSRVTVKTVVSY